MGCPQKNIRTEIGIPIETIPLVLYDLIKRAVHGDQEAIEAYLLHYDSYINSLVMYDEVGPDGQLHSYIDEDMKIQVQMKIVDALQNR